MSACSTNLKNQDTGELVVAPGAAAAKAIRHVLSVDVEDYFQVEAFADVVPRESWDYWPCRVVESTRVALDLFDRYQAKATFFFLGWIAKRFPELVREVHARGHELACHSFWHRPVYSLTPQEFREDTRAAREAIEQAAGVRVLGYRAPTWSITNSCLWALDILAEEGFAYDSSIYPIRHDLYGVPGACRFPHTLTCGNGKGLREFPPSTVRVAGVTLPVAGGGYLRILPFRFNEWAFRHIETTYGQPVVVYFHPWEFDPDQPRIPGKPRSRFRHYTNLRETKSRVQRLLELYTFQPFRALLPAETNRRVTVEVDPADCRDSVEGRRWESGYAGGLHDTSEPLRDRALGDLAGARLGEHLGRGASGNPSMILAYHEISAQPPNYIYAVSVRQLEEHLRVSLELCGGEHAKIPVPEVTFDDGHISNYRYALPLLEKYSRRAIFFVTVGWAGVRDEFMNWSQLRELVLLGHGVASHGWSHIPLTRCTPAEALEELRRSKLTLEDKLGVAAEAVSFPHGRWDRSILGLCARVGYRRVYTSNPWVPFREQDGVELLGRLMMRRTVCAAQFRRLLTLGRTARAIRRAEYDAKEVLRRILGDRTYHRLWGLMAGRYDPDVMR